MQRRRVLKIAAGVSIFIVGIPGLLDDIKTWQLWIKMNGWEWWNYLLVSIGLLLVLNATYPWLVRVVPDAKSTKSKRKTKSSTEKRDSSNLLFQALAVDNTGQLKVRAQEIVVIFIRLFVLYISCMFFLHFLLWMHVLGSWIADLLGLLPEC